MLHLLANVGDLVLAGADRLSRIFGGPVLDEAWVAEANDVMVPFEDPSPTPAYGWDTIVALPSQAS